MIHSIDEFLAEWAYESQNTLKLLSSLTDDSLKIKVYSEGRSLGYLAWHIVTTIPEMLGRTGLSLTVPEGHDKEPASASMIIEEYKKQSQSLVKALNDNWTNDTLNVDFEMYGDTWNGGMVLQALVKHEIHHRAQMTVLMRQAGLSIPGMYGPSKDDWSAMGAPVQK
ncbi:MAG: DinB family protein [Candidatus Kapaibacterium sp.]|jgi:uncharacterized damage-inducible protein DinB|nr:DinB family protein [Candidatus Kapabacteria bacterium]